MIMNEISSPANLREGIFQGSNDEEIWDDLYHIYEWNNTAGYKQTIQLQTKTAYKYFRLYIISGWSSGNGVSIQAMQIFKKEIKNIGFDEFGHSIEYDSAYDAGCNLNRWVDNNTVLYIPMYGDNPFIDQSKTNYSLINSGVIAVTNIAPQGSSGSGLFANSAYMYNITNSLLAGMTTFCIEIDFMLTSLPSGNEYNNSFYFMSCGPERNIYGIDFYIGSSGIIISPSNYNDRHLISYTPDINIWHRLKINRYSSGVFSVFIDKQLLGTVTDSSNFNTSANFCIGRCEPVGEATGYFQGYMANYRISNIERL